MSHKIVAVLNDNAYREFEAYKAAGKYRNNGRALESLLLEKTVLYAEVVKQGRKPKFLDISKLNGMLGKA